MRRFLGFVLCFVVLGLGPAVLRSQASAQCDSLPEIQVQGARAECVTVDALRERLVAYAARPAACGPARLVVAVQLSAAGGGAELALSRAGHRLSSRRFDQLPRECTELRDMLALSIALAVEHAIAEPSSQARSSPHAGSRVTPSALATGPSKQPRMAAGAESASAKPISAEVANPAAKTQPAEHAGSIQPAAPADEPTSEPEPDGMDSVDTPIPGAPKPDPTTPPVTAAQPIEAAPERDRTTASAQPAAAGQPLSFQLYAGGQGVLLSLPAPIWMGALGVEMSFGHTSVQLGGLAGLVDELPLGRGRARLELAGGELYACEGTGLADLHAQLCLGVMGAGLRAQGTGFAADRRGNSGWGAAALAAAVRWPREAKLSLRLSLRGLYSFVRPQLVVEEATEQALAAFGASARLELIFSLP